MNSVMNGKIRERTPFREVYVQPAAGDDGTALGAAFAAWHDIGGRSRRFVMDHAYWGPGSSSAEMAAALRERAGDLAGAGCVAREEPDPHALSSAVALRLTQGQVVGWFQGRAEWGARALGNRSILADPRRPEMRDVLNTRIKRREPFRPFAPAVLEEAVDDYFVGAVADPFMVQVYPVRPDRRATIPAVTHVDGTGRLQAVTRAANPVFWELIRSFEKLSGVPVLLNTSFNESEPIVQAPAEALDCFLRTRMDALVLGQTLVARSAG
jgi:carbamoyltransferase